MLGPWYRRKRLRAYVAEYENQGQARREANRAAKYGWVVSGVSSTDGHVNVGRTALKVVLFSPLALITGASRTKGKITVTYRRT